MGTTAVQALPYPELTDTADVPRDIKALADRLALMAGAVTSLPGSPADGQECFYIADATNGVVWHLRYRSAASGSYKWEFVGGGEMIATVAAAEPCTLGVYGNLATPGPDVTVPLAGDYVVGHGCTISSPVAREVAYMSFAIGATAAQDANNTFAVLDNAANGPSAISLARSQKITVTAANTLLRGQYKLSTGGATYEKRWLSAVPVRVG